MLHVVWRATEGIHKEVNSLSELFYDSGGGEDTPATDSAGSEGQREWGADSPQAAVW